MSGIEDAFDQAKAIGIAKAYLSDWHVVGFQEQGLLLLMERYYTLLGMIRSTRDLARQYCGKAVLDSWEPYPALDRIEDKLWAQYRKAMRRLAKLMEERGATDIPYSRFL